MPEDLRPETVGGDEYQVTPLELFFDLVFVFALTQVTSLLAHHPLREGSLSLESAEPMAS
jgi:low temperature requirement protein LtrA